MDEHLTDLACFEWVRFKATKLAPESGATVLAHLGSCPPCAAKVEDFRVLERSMEPYGAPLSTSRPRAWRRAVLFALVTAAAGIVSWIVF